MDTNIYNNIAFNIMVIKLMQALRITVGLSIIHVRYRVVCYLIHKY